jgi:hypothetical protein|tara:strand:- start:7710 stop:7874 length:165 start_codon:yes stop_codon:yes gene_type:complete
METLQEINDPKIVVVNDENKYSELKHSDNTKKPTFLEEQIRDYIPIDGEENETV